MTDFIKVGKGMKLLNYILTKETKNKPWSNEAIIKNLEKKPNLKKAKPK